MTWTTASTAPSAAVADQETEQCQFIENNHCKDCCEPCGQCGECIAGNHLETCPDCGLCVECCEFNSMMAGCEAGDICVESSNWFDSTCEDCGGFFTGDYEMCETCVDAGHPRCAACCRASSECAEGMCEYEEEYETHFCVDCGQCFHDVDRCTTCEADRCEDCCTARTEANYGCTHGYCEEDPYFDAHLTECEDADAEFVDDHDAAPSNRWSFDASRYSFHENDDGSWRTTILTAGWPTGGILLLPPHWRPAAAIAISRTAMWPLCACTTASRGTASASTAIPPIPQITVPTRRASSPLLAKPTPAAGSCCTKRK